MALTGPEGSGKSHLAAIWAKAAGGRVVASHAIDASSVPQALSSGALAIEDADRGEFDENLPLPHQSDEFRQDHRRRREQFCAARPPDQLPQREREDNAKDVVSEPFHGRRTCRCARGRARAPG